MVAATVKAARRLEAKKAATEEVTSYIHAAVRMVETRATATAAVLGHIRMACFLVGQLSERGAKLQTRLDSTTSADGAVSSDAAVKAAAAAYVHEEYTKKGRGGGSASSSTSTGGGGSGASGGGSRSSHTGTAGRDTSPMAQKRRYGRGRWRRGRFVLDVNHHPKQRPVGAPRWQECGQHDPRIQTRLASTETARRSKARALEAEAQIEALMMRLTAVGLALGYIHEACRKIQAAVASVVGVRRSI